MKKRYDYLILYVFLLCILALFSGCSDSKTQKCANELIFSLDNISDLKISYDEENISLCQGDGNELIVKEFMSTDHNRYHARVNQRGDSLQISEGSRPLFHKNFTRRIEVYLPLSFQESFSLHTTSGNIDISTIASTLHSFSVDSTSGKINLASVNASKLTLSTTSGKLICAKLTGDEIDITTTKGQVQVESAISSDGHFKISTTSGPMTLGKIQSKQIYIESKNSPVKCNTLNGAVIYKTTSGSINVTSAIGCGQYQSENSGKMCITYTKLAGDLSLFNKNDAIDLTLPNTMSFVFQASTKNGLIDVPFGDQLTASDHSVSGTIGHRPSAMVSLETKNGNIHVRLSK